MDKFEDLISEIKNHKLIILDFDGTIVDLGVNWNELKDKLSEYIYEKKKVKINFRKIDAGIEEVNERFGARLSKDLVKIVKKYELDESNYSPNTKLIEYLNSTNKKIAVYSMNSSETINLFFKKNIKQKPQYVISRENKLESKPSGKNIELILDKLGVEKKDVIYLGDKDVDLESGKMAKVKTIII